MATLALITFLRRTLGKLTQLFVKSAALCFVLSAACISTHANSAVSVSYTISGSSGAWVLDFSVSNNINPGQGIYFFGVLLPAVDVVGTPTGSGWMDCAGRCGATYNPSSLGGPNLDYNNLWINLPPAGMTTGQSGILFGQTLSGFQTGVTSALPPLTVDWLLFSNDYTANGSATYTGGGNFFSNDNPGFADTGDGTLSTVPEPSSLCLLGSGLLGLAWKKIRRG